MAAVAPRRANPADPFRDHPWARTTDEVVAAMRVERSRGLTADEAARRLEDVGRNDPAWSVTCRCGARCWLSCGRR